MAAGMRLVTSSMSTSSSPNLAIAQSLTESGDRHSLGRHCVARATIVLYVMKKQVEEAIMPPDLDMEEALRLALEASMAEEDQKWDDL
jgi:hypothetical protein